MKPHYVTAALDRRAAAGRVTRSALRAALWACWLAVVISTWGDHDLPLAADLALYAGFGAFYAAWLRQGYVWLRTRKALK